MVVGETQIVSQFKEAYRIAKELGYEIAWKKLQSLLERLKKLKRDFKNVVVYCWRGGLRSQELCKREGLLLIVDEVQTGIGRTGKFYAYQH